MRLIEAITNELIARVYFFLAACLLLIVSVISPLTFLYLIKEINKD